MAVLIGIFTLGRDAETRVTAGGTTVVQLACVYNYGRKGDDGKRPSQWIRVSMFGKQAEALAPYFLKGKQVSLIIKDVHVATFQKQDGTTGTSLEGVADFDDFARGPQTDAPAPRPAPAPAPQQRQQTHREPSRDDFGDDSDPIPF